MGLFGRKTPEGADRIAEFVSLARVAFAEQGVETTIEATNDPSNPRLVASDGQSYFIHNLMVTAGNEPPRRWPALTRDHVGRMLSASRAAAPKDLDAEALARQVRTRLLSDAPDDTNEKFAYARPFAPGLMLALCIDYPETVSTLMDGKVETLALTIDELFVAGQHNTNLEPIDEHNEVDDGVWIIGGSSLFIASKVADLPDLVESTIGTAPRGLVFSVPHRHLLLYTKLETAASISSIGTLLQITTSITADQNSAPGGVLSPCLYFWNRGEVQAVGGPNSDGGAPAVWADGAFLDAINALVE